MKRWSITQLILGMVQTNCYILSNEVAKECLIIDPADQPDQIYDELYHQGHKAVAILLTHGHFDHLHGAAELQKKGIPVYILEEDGELARDPQLNASLAFTGRGDSVEADHLLRDGQLLELAGLNIRVIGTPGHTKGSCCYYLEKEGILFSGDTLFCMSYGRTDLPTGKESDIWHSIQEKLLVLPKETVVYPGHGEATTIGFEQENNPAAGWGF